MLKGMEHLLKVLGRREKMDSKNYFKQRLISLSDIESNDYIYSDELLLLIKNEELKSYIINKYDLHDNLKIEINKIDNIYAIVNEYISKFSLLRLNVSFDKVKTVISPDGEDVIFSISEAIDESDAFVENLEAEAIYDSIAMFYEKRKLTQYVNYLKKNNRNGFLLNKLSESWEEYYKANPKSIDKKIFRILDEGDKQYVKSINSSRYKEYGIAETFVLTFLELHFISKRDNRKFSISSLAISESKIEIIISVDEVKYIKGLGKVYSSITVRNEDQGNTSIGFYGSLEFKLEKEIDGKIFLFPSKTTEGIENKYTMNHTCNLIDFVESHKKIAEFFNQCENFETEYFFFKESLKYDELRAKIEEKVTSNKSPFKGISELVDLFRKDKVGHIDNLASLLKLCGKAELLNIDFDLKFKLRYIISNILLYGKDSG